MNGFDKSKALLDSMKKQMEAVPEGQPQILPCLWCDGQMKAVKLENNGKSSVLAICNHCHATLFLD